MQPLLFQGSLDGSNVEQPESNQGRFRCKWLYGLPMVLYFSPEGWEPTSMNEPTCFETRCKKKFVWMPIQKKSPTFLDLNMLFVKSKSTQTFEIPVTRLWTLVFAPCGLLATHRRWRVTSDYLHPCKRPIKLLQCWNTHTKGLPPPQNTNWQSTGNKVRKQIPWPRLIETWLANYGTPNVSNQGVSQIGGNGLFKKKVSVGLAHLGLK